MFLREQKEPRELNSHSRLKRIITPLRQFQTWAFNTPEDYYDVTVSICVLVHCVCLLSATSRTRCFSGTPKLSPPSRWNQTPLAGRGGSCRHFVFLTYFVHQNGQYAEAIAVSCEDEDHLVAIVPENVRDPNKRVNVKSGDDQKIIGCNVQ